MLNTNFSINKYNPVSNFRNLNYKKNVITFGINSSDSITVQKNMNYEKIGQECIDYVSNLGINSSNRNVNPSDWKYLHQGEVQKKIFEIRETMRKDFSDKGKTLSEYITSCNKITKKEKVGNCSEQMFLAAQHIKEKYPKAKVKLIQYNASIYKEFYNEYIDVDHCFIILGLPDKFDISKLSDKNAVKSLKNVCVVDPWASFCEPLDKGLEKIDSKLGLKLSDERYYSSGADKLCNSYKLKKDINL